jgi:hypothetical protein
VVRKLVVREFSGPDSQFLVSGAEFNAENQERRTGNRFCGRGAEQYFRDGKYE